MAPKSTKPDRYSQDSPAPAVVVRSSPRHGRGVFTTRKVAAGEFLDASPVLFLSADDGDHIMATPLRNYIFEIDDRYALACGPASFLNHSYAPNAEYVIDLDASILELLALEPIPAGSEVLINYNGSPNDHAPLWFDLAQE